MKYLILILISLFCMQAKAQTPEENIKNAGFVLPPISKPIANYVKFVRTGNLIFLSGHGPTRTDGTNITGKLGKPKNILR